MPRRQPPPPPPPERAASQDGSLTAAPRRLGISGYWGLMRDGYDELVKAIIRPPRAQYTLRDLGPAEFQYGGVSFVRQDVSIPNRRGLALCGSLWRRVDMQPGASFPCVVYLHGNASCRAEATTIAAQVLALGAALFSFDFAGCGHSEGEYISLGFFERDDVQTMIEWLREYAGVGAIALWGRSMGASSAVMQAARDPSIAGLVLDSPFASLEQVALELVGGGPDGDRPEGVPNVPPFLVKTALRLVASSVKARAAFDIYKCRPIDHAATCFMPAVFATAHDDALVRPHHSRLILDAYAGDKNLVTFDGDHNEMRPGFFLDSAAIFFTNVLRLDGSSALDVPTGQDGRPIPLSQALQFSYRLRHDVGDQSADLAAGADAQRQMMRAHMQAQLADQQAAEAEMLARAIQESLESASSADPPPLRTQHSSLTHAPLGRPSVSGRRESLEEADSMGSGEEAAHARFPGEGDASDGEDEALAEAIKLSLLDKTAS